MDLLVGLGLYELGLGFLGSSGGLGWAQAVVLQGRLTHVVFDWGGSGTRVSKLPPGTKRPTWACVTHGDGTGVGQ